MRFRSSTVIYCATCDLVEPHRHGGAACCQCGQCGGPAVAGVFVSDAVSIAMTADPILTQTRTITGRVRPRR